MYEGPIHLRRRSCFCWTRHAGAAYGFCASLTSLGHFEKILARPKYRHLAEAEPNNSRPWLAVLVSCRAVVAVRDDPGAKELLADMYGEFAPNFSSGQFNICCDEAYDLGGCAPRPGRRRSGQGNCMSIGSTLRRTREGSRQTQVHSIVGDIIITHPELIGSFRPMQRCWSGV